MPDSLTSNLRVIESFRSKDGVKAEVAKYSLGGAGCVVIQADTATGDEAEVTLSAREAHDLMLWLQCALGITAVETPAELVCPHGVRVVQGVNCLCGREVACYSCFVEGCPGNHLSKRMICSAVEPSEPSPAEVEEQLRQDRFIFGTAFWTEVNGVKRRIDPTTLKIETRSGALVQQRPEKATDDLNCLICGKLWRSQHTDQERAECSAAL